MGGWKGAFAAGKPERKSHRVNLRERNKTFPRLPRINSARFHQVEFALWTNRFQTETWFKTFADHWLDVDTTRQQKQRFSLRTQDMRKEKRAGKARGGTGLPSWRKSASVRRRRLCGHPLQAARYVNHTITRIPKIPLFPKTSTKFRGIAV